MRKLLLVLGLLLPFWVEGQLITTFAGNGTSGISGDGGSALSASIALPVHGCFDKYGNYYFVGGLSNDRVRMVDPNGIIHTVAGIVTGGFGGDGGPATLAMLSKPYGVVVDAGGNIYISDYGNNRIRKVDGTTHVISTIAGNGTPTSTGDGGLAVAATVVPYGLCLDKAGNLYFIDGFGSKVRRIDLGGNISTVAGTGIGGFSGDGGPATLANLAMNYGICIDSADNIYMACDTRIRKVDKMTGIISTYAGTGFFAYIGDGIPATSAQFNAYNIGIDTARHNLYIADDVNDRVYQIDAAGIFHLVAGTGTGGYNGDGIVATTA